VLRFGTDGVRGDADTDLTSALMLGLGRALGEVFGGRRFFVGRDTRASGQRIAHELGAGLGSKSVEPVQLGVMPTPAIAFTAASEGFPAAIVSASHNPWSDNGVKVVGADGRKLPDETETEIERALAAQHGGAHTYRGDDLDFTADAARGDAYVRHLLGALEGRSLAGCSLVLDCANGAAFELAPRTFERAGARVHVINAAPDGRNINAGCGSTHPESLRRAVRERGADLGLALDGDADRVLAIDERGQVVDGDQIMTMTALDMKARGALTGDAVVVTVMSNLGLRHAMRDAGVDVVETSVGDRHVVAAMQERGIVVGGEQSGHIVYAQHATTGDGALTGLLLCDLVQRAGARLSTLAAQMTRYPQVLVNVRVGRVDLDHAPALWDAVHAVEAELGDDGRVLVRASGTEPLVRVMVEAGSRAVAEQAANRLKGVVEAEFGLS
jgi:phosphoglucosamine mutase